MKLIVGLGNPGKEYQNTRHNMGFMVVDNFAKAHDVVIDKEKNNGLFCKIDYNNETIVLLKPLSYMNLSGEVVKSYMKWYKIKKEDILVISDDLDLPFCKTKLKEKGSCGGHNGLRNIEDNIKSTVYKRLKIGIANDKTIEAKDYVLGKFNEKEKEQIRELLKITNNILEDYLKVDFERVMNKYN